MFPYFPFSHDSFKMLMGVQALHADHLIEVDNETYPTEMALKDALLISDPTSYFQAMPETEASQWEVIALLLPAMARRYPQYFSLIMHANRWSWHNHLRNQKMSFCFGERQSLPLAPLDWIGRQVQEDLLLLSNESVLDLPLVAGQLCFPNAWSLDEKMGKSFSALHQEVPFFAEQIGRSSQLLMKRLKVGRPVWRLNWALKTVSRLNLTPRFFHEIPASRQGLSLENIGERCFLRVERQALARLPVTQAILFTIHTYQIPLSAVAVNHEHATRMTTVLRTVPYATRVYKDIHEFVDMVIAYLDRNT
jgi:hypothetical protein